MINPDGFLMIEPKGHDEEPVIDEITRKVAFILHSKENAHKRWYRGFHTCSCGQMSDNGDWTVKIGDKTYQTNSLIVHYMACHRSQVAPETLDFIAKLNVPEEDPAVEELGIQGSEERQRRFNHARKQAAVRTFANGHRLGDVQEEYDFFN